MAKKMKALVLRNICTEDGEIVRKGNNVELSGKDMERFLDIGAVERPRFVASDLDDKKDDKKIEGGDA